VTTATRYSPLRGADARRRKTAPTLRVDRIGLRTWLAAALVGLSVADPGIFTQYGLYVALVIWLAGSPIRFRTDRVFWATVLMVGWMFATTAWSINLEAANFANASVRVAIVFLVLRDTVRTQRQLQTVAIAYLIASFAAVGRVLADGYRYAGPTQRYTLEGLNANYLGYALIGALPVIVLLWNLNSGRKGRVFLAAAAVGALLGLQLTGTRGAAVGAVSLALWLLSCRALSRPPVKALIIALASAAIIITSGLLDLSLRLVDFGSRSTGDLSGRLLLWPAARELWSQSWLVGSGLSSVRTAGGFGLDAHSVFLEIGSAQGFIGVALFVAFLTATLGYDTRLAPSRFRGMVLGSFLAAMAPAYLTGAWEATPAAWMLLLIFSRIGTVGSDFPQAEIADVSQIDPRQQRGTRASDPRGAECRRVPPRTTGP
jgi:O-antigen ligase